MPRPKHCRCVGSLPGSSLFKPAGVPACSLGEVVLAVDEFEALRLADYEALYQEQAAERMRISRQTFGRIVETARRKVAQALVEGLALRIEGGKIEMATMRAFACADCQHVWEVPFGTGRPAGCPACQGKNFHRAVEAAVAQPDTAQRPAAGRCCRHRNGPGGRRLGRRAQGRN
ncbi:MAG: DUF134 domain-containing protein [Thermoguttaceae bacterium]